MSSVVAVLAMTAAAGFWVTQRGPAMQLAGLVAAVAASAQLVWEHGVATGLVIATATLTAAASVVVLVLAPRPRRAMIVAAVSGASAALAFGASVATGGIP